MGKEIDRELDRIASLCGYICMVVSDNGIELPSNAILEWSSERKAKWPHTILGGLTPV